MFLKSFVIDYASDKNRSTLTDTIIAGRIYTTCIKACSEKLAKERLETLLYDCYMIRPRILNVRRNIE